MTDTRELILARLATIAAGITGVRKVYRNQLSIDENICPAIVILDADEQIDPARPANTRHVQSPILLDLKPEIFIVLGDVPENVGPKLNTLRVAAIKSILSDAQLLTLCGAQHGRISYEGCMTALGSGRAMVGEMALQFTFTYLLRPDLL